MMARSTLPAAFLDRDGVINEDRAYVHRVEEFAFIGGAIEGMRILAAQGYALVIVTNQAGIGRGRYPELAYQRLTEHMLAQLQQAGIEISAVYHCPHHPDAGEGHYRTDCNCRKPAPGMLLRAAEQLHLDLSRSIMIGDKSSDISAGRAAGVSRCVLVASGHPVEADAPASADHFCANLLQAARWIVEQDTAQHEC